MINSMYSFLDELEKALGNMNAEARREILDDFTEHFRLAREEGKSDGQIIEALGSPQSIAGQFFETYGIKAEKQGFQTPPSFDNNRHSEVFYNSESEAVENEFSVNGVERIHIDVNVAEVKITADHIQTIKTQIRVFNKKSQLQTFQESGSIEIIEKSQYGLFNFPFFHRKPAEIKVFVPIGSLLDFDLSTRFGNTEIRGCTGKRLIMNNSFDNVRMDSTKFDNVSINTKAGNINLDRAAAENSDIHTSAGDITATEGAGILEAHTSAGNIKIKKHRGGNINARSTAGNVFIDNAEGIIKAYSSAGNVTIETLVSEYAEGGAGAGNVDISAHDVKGLKLSAKSGNAKAHIDRILGNAEISAGAGNVELEADLIQGDINAHSGTGNVEVKLPRDTAMRILAKRGVGSFINTLPNNEQSPYTLTASASVGTVKLIGK